MRRWFARREPLSGTSIRGAKDMVAGRRILIVEDDPEISDVLFKLLSGEGATPVRASSREEFETTWQSDQYDLVMLDLNLPDGDGLGILRQLRQRSNIPIIILTARIEEIDEVLALELGANDFITKPFRTRSLIARIQRALRPAVENDGPIEEDPMSRFEVQGWRFETEGRVLISPNGDRVPLTAGEYRLLRTLFEHRDQVVSRKDLSVAVFGRQVKEDNRSMDALVFRLRAKFASDGVSDSVIRTVVGAGYTFNFEPPDRFRSDKPSS